MPPGFYREIPERRFTAVAIVFLLWMAVPGYSLAAIAFEDATTQSRISYSGMSFGVSWGDLNGDGLPDLWTGNHYNPLQQQTVWVNAGDGSFTEATIPIDLTRGDLHGAAWADVDNDGDQDLLVQVGAYYGTTSDPNRFYENVNGTLVEKAAAVGLDYPLGRGRTPMWLDWNGDGKLDVILTNAQRSDGLAPTALFSQDENGNFADSSAATGFQTTKPYNEFSHLITWVLNLPGSSERIKIPVAFVHAFGFPDQAYAFLNSWLVPLDLPVTPSQYNTRDVAVADFNGDLLSDIYLARTGADIAALKDTLLLQDESLGLIDSPQWFANVADTSCESAAAADFDNDMDVDVYLVCLQPFSNSPNILLENTGDGKFIQVPMAGGAEGSIQGRGESVAAADYDQDGYVDLAVTNGRGGPPYSDDGPTQLYRNMGGANHWLEIDLEGVVSNRDAIGASIVVTAGGVSQLREQGGGMHRYSQNYKRVHFGLAGNTQVDEITVTWPSGIVQILNDVPADQIIRIVEEGEIPDPPEIVLTPEYPKSAGAAGLWLLGFAGLLWLIQRRRG